LRGDALSAVSLLQEIEAIVKGGLRFRLNDRK
jgi:hypothetical protein